MTASPPLARPVCIFRCQKEEGLYLYVNQREGLQRVPEELLKQLGRTELAMTLDLAPERKLARADSGKVLQALDEQGYYLQLPPRHGSSAESDMLSIRQANSKL